MQKRWRNSKNASSSLYSSLGFVQDVCRHAGRLVPKDPQTISIQSWPAVTSSSSRRFCFEAACVVHMLLLLLIKPDLPLLLEELTNSPWLEGKQIKFRFPTCAAAHLINCTIFSTVVLWPRGNHRTLVGLHCLCKAAYWEKLNSSIYM